MVKEGMDVARLNFSHSTHKEHKKNIALIRSVSSDLKKCISIIGDLQGPKIRVKKIIGGFAEIREGQEFTITTDNVIGDKHRVATTFTKLPDILIKGSRILLDDGALQMRVKKVTKKEVICEVTVGGILKDHKGINLPGIVSDTAAVTKKDKEDLAFAIKNGVDFIAISFVRKAADVAAVKNIIAKSGNKITVIAKLEKPEAMKNLDSIIEVSDGLMIARGDLGVEMNPEKVPILQKNIIKKANAMGKFVITATQMLDSMAEHPRPTRAEASDVANAIFDGSDALMLSRETAVGQYPVEVVNMMAKIINEVENSEIWESAYSIERREKTGSFSKTITHVAKYSAYELNAKAIAAFSMSGYTGKLISNVRPATPIVCFTSDETVVRDLNIYWGVKPFKIKLVKNLEDVIKLVERKLLAEKIAKVGDVVIIICGMPIIAKGQTNLLKVHKIERISV
jgi:pyruvate kinase